MTVKGRVPGPDRPRSAPTGSEPVTSPRPLPVARRMRDLGERVVGLFRHPVWNIGVVHEPIHAFLESESRPEIHWFPPPRSNTYLADPFGLARDSEVVVFCEEYDYLSGRGTLCGIELSGRGPSSPPRAAFDLPVHASYPFVFSFDGEAYCVPETSRAREVSLFKATEFPFRWAKVATILPDLAGLDNTVFPYNGRWWLACTNYERNPDSDLLIWHAASPKGPWEPHAANPVKSDNGSSRPAGTPFLHKGHLYRPAQDSSRTYGGRIVLNRVRRLTTRDFEEEPAAVIEPYPGSPYPAGVHTISSAGDVTLIDGHRFTFIDRAFSSSLHRELAHARTWASSLLQRG